jgi:hypothetical protein
MGLDYSAMPLSFAVKDLYYSEHISTSGFAISSLGSGLYFPNPLYFDSNS